jgi:hypothetical protein
MTTWTNTLDGSVIWTGADDVDTEGTLGGATVIATGSTTARTLAARFAETINVKDFGAVGDQSTNDTVAIQAAIDSLIGSYSATRKGGIVYLPPGTYRVSAPLVLPSFVHLVGAGMGATNLFLSNNANCAVIKTADFDTLTGSGKAVTIYSSIPVQFGIRDLTIEGNNFNNTATACVQIYGKRFLVQNVMIQNAAGVGYYSECGLGGVGEVYVENPVEQIEAIIRNLAVRKASSHGIVYRGPTDSPIESAFVASCGGDGIRLETSSSGSAYTDVAFVHSYGNAGYGVYVDCAIRGGHLCGESNVKDGLYFTTNSYSAHVQFAEAYGNDRNSAGTYWQVNLAAGGGVTIGQAKVTVNKSTDAGGILVASNLNRIENAWIIGNAVATGKAVSVTGSRNWVSAVTDIFATGSTGAHVTGNDNLMDIMASGVSTGLAHPGVTTGNRFRLRTDLLVGGVKTSGVAFGATETYDDSAGLTIGGALAAASFSPTASTIPLNGFYLPGAGTLGWATGGALRGVLDSSGRLVVGAGAATNGWAGSNTPYLQTLGTGDSGSAGLFARYSANTSQPRLHLNKSRGAAIGDHAAVVSGDGLGDIVMGGSDGAQFVRAASFAGVADGTPTSGSVPGKAVVRTTSAGGSDPQDRLFADSKGNIVVGTAAIGTTATDGFLYIPTCAGTPSGTPTAYSGRSPIVHDTTGNKLFVYSGSAWRAVTLA